MYAEHMPQINRWARQSTANMNQLAIAVSLTIQQPFKALPNLLHSVKNTGPASPHLWGMKRTTYTTLQKNPTTLYKLLAPTPEQSLINIRRNIPGLGNVKAGFLLQLLGYNIGCLDIHNLRAYNLKAHQVRDMKPAQYIALCQSLGGSETLWNNWCHIMSERYPEKTAHEWSAFHLHMTA